MGGKEPAKQNIERCHSDCMCASVFEVCEHALLLSKLSLVSYELKDLVPQCFRDDSVACMDLKTTVACVQTLG